MLRTVALRSVGLYDATIFGYTEDAELCLRLERAGWAVRVVQGAIAEQSSGQPTRPGLAAFLQTRNGLSYASKLAGQGAVWRAGGCYARETVHYARLAATGPRRQMSLIQCFATWIGVVAFLSGRRSGPPPPWLPGQGDVAVRRPGWRAPAGKTERKG
jgi:hypothetical protein